MFYIGAGAAFLTKEKLEELRTELIEKGKMTQDEGKQFIDDIVKKSEEAKTQLDEHDFKLFQVVQDLSLKYQDKSMEGIYKKAVLNNLENGYSFQRVQ